MGGADETILTVRAGVAQATSLTGTATVDFGIDPNSPTTDSEFFRVFSNVLFITPTRTLSLDLSVIADEAADRCSFNGVAVPSWGARPAEDRRPGRR